MTLSAPYGACGSWRTLMAERVEERLQDLERLVIKQSERIEELEQHLTAAMRMARQGALRARAQENKAA